MASVSKYSSNYHARVVEAKIEDLFSEIVKWGEGTWWPKDALMKFGRDASGPVSEGTEYIQKVKLPFGPSWRAVVSEVKNNQSITRRFKGGLFEGTESVSLKQMCCHKVKVEYEMLFRIKGLFNKVLWKVMFRRLHDSNIENILESLKAYIESKGRTSLRAPKGRSNLKY